MANAMKHLKSTIPFGFGSTTVGTVTVFTIRLIFKGVLGYQLPSCVTRVFLTRGRTMLTVTTTDHVMYQEACRVIRGISKDIALTHVMADFVDVSNETMTEVAATKTAPEPVYHYDHADLPF